LLANPGRLLVGVAWCGLEARAERINDGLDSTSDLTKSIDAVGHDQPSPKGTSDDGLFGGS
jgi:hypothetical protein